MMQGTLKVGDVIAIKKTFMGSSRMTNFHDELKIISNVNHRHLAWNLYESGTQMNLMDDKLDPSEYETEDARRIIQIALMCTQPAVAARPVMSEVVALIIENLLEVIPSVRPYILDDDVKMHVPTMQTSTSDATASTVQLSGL
ncbi:hypothetical protein L1887_17741 [Cichorium endivia]|nr:hypothetical protein L1887_17741 [Cichorium endivia]